MKIAACFLFEKQAVFCVLKKSKNFFKLGVGICPVPVGIGEGVKKPLLNGVPPFAAF